MIWVSIIISGILSFLDLFHKNNHKNNDKNIVMISISYSILFCFVYVICFIFPVLILKEGILASVLVAFFTVPLAILCYMCDTSYINYENNDYFIMKNITEKRTYMYKQIVDIRIDKTWLYFKMDDSKEYQFPYMYDNIDDFYKYALMRMKV